VRGPSALFLLLTLPLCACSPKTEAPTGLLGLDCTQPFEAQAAALIAQPSMKPAPEDRAEPYKFYSSEDGRTSYLITKPGAPGHPAIMMQRAAGGEVKTTGCPYGDKKSYEQLLAYLEGLKEWHR
jgi:hypothetical protein